MINEKEYREMWSECFDFTERLEPEFRKELDYCAVRDYLAGLLDGYGPDGVTGEGAARIGITNKIVEALIDDCEYCLGFKRREQGER